MVARSIAGACACASQSRGRAVSPRNGFRGIFDRDTAGWSPLCFAAMDGRPLLITALLQQRADPNDKTSKGKLEDGCIAFAGIEGTP